MRKILKIILTIAPILILVGISISSRIIAEKYEETPESNVASNVKTLYDSLVILGNGDESSGVLGAFLNRISSAAEWIPNGTITANDIARYKQFYNGSRETQTSTALWGDYQGQLCGRYGPSLVTQCACVPITKITQAGTAASVTDNAVKRSLMSNTTYYDPLTKLYWSDFVSTPLDNEFSYVNGDDRVNPTGASCNFNSTGTANQYCDNQDPTGVYTEDNDVSAADLCLNLQLDADNADGDANGLTGVETDWRLPTVNEAIQGTIDCLIIKHTYLSFMEIWTSTENYADSSKAYAQKFYPLDNHMIISKSTSKYVACVRRAN